MEVTAITLRQDVNGKCGMALVEMKVFDYLMSEVTTERNMVQQM